MPKYEMTHVDCPGESREQYVERLDRGEGTELELALYTGPESVPEHWADEVVTVVWDVFCSIEDRDLPRECPRCGRIIKNPRVVIPLSGSRVDTGGGYKFGVFTKARPGRPSRFVEGNLGRSAPLAKSGVVRGKWR